MSKTRTEMEEISKKLQDHYRKTFIKHGTTSKGVDWGDNEWITKQRQAKMLEVINQVKDESKVSLLDVGCGYGALADLVHERNLNISYTGIDLVDEMVSAAQKRHPKFNFISGDIMNLKLEKYDYVTCNGILTQKLNTSNLAMNHFAQVLIKKIFNICRNGVAFNIMSTFVNFQENNLYYRNPSELMAWCMSEVTPRIRFDSTYEPWYEYTIYLYR
ncbi:methyltransferase domain-containing protein [Opitutales bacterium]|nr:methyltransferase domain-containing protein [Opitutales bacterium]